MQFSRTKNQRWTLLAPLLALALATTLLSFQAQAQIPQYKLENPDNGHTPGRMGRSIAVDGDTMIVGAPLSNPNGIRHAGMARVYLKDGFGSWTLQTDLIASDGGPNDYFGLSVSISGDTAFVGALGDDDAGYASGSAYIFTRSGGVWSEQQKLTASDAVSGEIFGHSVSISGDTAIVGVNGDNDAGDASGSAYIFTRSRGVWSEQQKLIASDATIRDFFGISVSISGDMAIVGADGDDDGGIASGSAYVFTRSGGVWSEQQKLTASDVVSHGLFGISVSISGDTTVVGAHRGDDQFYDYGSAYVFTRSGGVWSEQQKLTAPDAAEGDYFGYSVSISGDKLVAGAFRDDDGKRHSGLAYVFTRLDGVWSIGAELLADDAAEGDFFGVAVAIAGDQVFVGAPYKDDPAIESGAAYVFDISNMPPLALAGPPVLEDLTTTGSGLLNLTWTNSSLPPARSWGFAWDLYTKSWVENGSNGMWYNLSSAASPGEMNLGYSGAYFVWVGSQYANGAWYPCENPGMVLLNSGGSPPHKPLDVVATDKGGQVVTLIWRPDIYGTWLYWIIALDVNANEWVTLGGPRGQRVWQYVAHGSGDYRVGSVNLALSAPGQYRFFIQGLAWDGETLGEFSSTSLTTTVR